MKCSKCDSYKKELEKYKQKYETAKSGLTDDERYMLIELICQEQLFHHIPKDKYNFDTYKQLEELKAKIRIV